MKKYKQQENWIIKEDIFLVDKTINKLVDFEKNVLNKYLSRKDYKVYIDECQDIDFVVYDKEKFKQILADENVISDIAADNFDDEIRFFIKREENKFKIRRL